MANDAFRRWPTDSVGADLADDAAANGDDGELLGIIRERIGGGSQGAHSRVVREVHEVRDVRLEWERRLSLRGKLWRGGLATLTVALIAFLLAGGPAATMQALNALRQPPASAAPANDPLTFDNAPFSWTPPPIGGAHRLNLAVTPGAAHPWTSFACWLQTPTLATRGAITRQIFLAYHPNKQNNLWAPLPTPAYASATGCAIIADAANPSGLLLDLGAPSQATDPCALTTLFASADLGAHWRRLDWPNPTLTACGQREALIGGRVYVWANTSLLPPGQRHTTNDGRIITCQAEVSGPLVWAQADAGLGDLAALNVVGERPGGGALAVGDETASGQTRVLLASQNYGVSWQREGALPGAYPQVYVSGNPDDVAHGGWGRLYTLAQTVTHGIPGGPAHTMLATAYLGERWSPVPLPPRTPTLPDGSTFNNPTVVGVTTNDALLVVRGARIWNDNAAVPTQPLWLWDTTHARWLLDQSLTPENVIAMRLSWTQGLATLWVVSAELVMPPTIVLLTATFTPLPLAASTQRVAGG